MKLSVENLSALVELGLNVAQRIREARGVPVDAELTAEEVRAIKIGEVDDLIAEGRSRASEGR